MSNSNHNRLDRAVHASSQRNSEENENQDEGDEDSLLDEDSEFIPEEDEEDEEDEEECDSDASIGSDHRKSDRRGSTNTTPANSDTEQQRVRGQTSTPSPRQSTRLGGRKPSSLGWTIEYSFISLIIERWKKGWSFNHHILRALLRRALNRKWVICSFQDIGLTCFLHLCRCCRIRGVSYNCQTIYVHQLLQQNSPPL